jgi:ankyrin repeat protein
MTNRYFNVLNLLLLAMTVFLGVKIFYMLESPHLDDALFSVTNTRNGSSPSDRPDQPLSFYQPIIERNLLNTKAGETVSLKKLGIATLKKTDLKLKLLGTAIGDVYRPYAVIEETEKREQQLYREGNDIQNATIKRILREKVVLRVNGRDEVLKVEKNRQSIITGIAEVNANIKDRRTALLDASNRGLKEKVALLIAQGADVNARDIYGNTPLMTAARSGHSEIVQLLIANGADIHLKDNLGNTPLIDTARYASEFALRVIEILIAEGANVQAKNMYSTTALMNAVRSGRSEVVKLLLNEGADVNAKSKTGQTALKLAADCLRKDVIEVLKEHGARQH